MKTIMNIFKISKKSDQSPQKKIENSENTIQDINLGCKEVKFKLFLIN